MITKEQAIRIAIDLNIKTFGRTYRFENAAYLVVPGDTGDWKHPTDEEKLKHGDRVRTGWYVSFEIPQGPVCDPGIEIVVQPWTGEASFFMHC